MYGFLMCGCANEFSLKTFMIALQSREARMTIFDLINY